MLLFISLLLSFFATFLQREKSVMELLRQRKSYDRYTIIDIIPLDLLVIPYLKGSGEDLAET